MQVVLLCMLVAHVALINQAVSPCLQIPLSAVEMPEDAMAALDVQFSGLEFGTETLDFTAEVKTSSSATGLVNTTPVNACDPASTPPATKDLTSASLSSSLPQTQKVGPHRFSSASTREHVFSDFVMCTYSWISSSQLDSQRE